MISCHDQKYTVNVDRKIRRSRVGGDPDSRLIPTFLCKGTGRMPGSPPTRGRRIGNHTCISQSIYIELFTKPAFAPKGRSSDTKHGFSVLSSRPLSRDLIQRTENGDPGSKAGMTGLWNTALLTLALLILPSPLTAWSLPWSKTKTLEDKQLELQRKQIDDPANPYINYNVGVAAYKKKQFDTASASFDRAIQNAPDKPIFKKQAHFNLGQAHYHQALDTVGASWQTVKLSDETIDKAIEQTVKSVKEFDAVLVLESEDARAKKMKSEVELFQQKLLAKKYENKDNKDKKDQKKDGQQNQKGDGQGDDKNQQQGGQDGQGDQKNNQSGNDKNSQQGDKQKGQEGQDKPDENKPGNNKKDGQGKDDKDNGADQADGKQNKNDAGKDKDQGGTDKDKQQGSPDPHDTKANDKQDNAKKDGDKKDDEQAGTAGKHDDKKDQQAQQEMPGDAAPGEEIPGTDVMDHALDAHAKSVLDAVEQAEGNAQKRAMAAELSKMRQANVGGNQKPW